MALTDFTRADRYQLEGTGGLGYINTRYADLVRVFGEPDDGSGDGKTQAEWAVQFADGLIATIYDWKEYDTEVEDVTEWAVGGREHRAIDRVRQALSL
jgi:hypothetical protein